MQIHIKCPNDEQIKEKSPNGHDKGKKNLFLFGLMLGYFSLSCMKSIVGKFSMNPGPKYSPGNTQAWEGRGRGSGRADQNWCCLSVDPVKIVI